jgi:hypothetical protein
VSLLDRFNLKSPNFYFIPLFTLAIFENLIAATWNVDPYHEGALFPTAVGLAEGLAPFREINQQYGFLGPLLVSLLLRLFGNYLIVERIFGFTLTLLISWVFYTYLKTLTSKTIAKFIPLVWLSISPIWSWPLGLNALSGGYWPNQLGTFLVLSGLLLLKRPKSAAFLAGFLILLSSQARVEFIFVWLSMSVAIFINEKEKRLFWVVGSFFSGLIIYFYLLSNNSVSQWFRQTLLVWTMDPPDVVKINIKFLILNLINFLTISALGLLMLVLAWALVSKCRKFWIALSLQTIIVFAFLSVSGHLNFQIKIGNFDLVTPFRIAFADTLFSFINLTLLLCFLVICFLILQERIVFVRQLNLINSSMLLLMSASVGLLGLFHNFNPDYTHMVWPIFALLMVSLVQNLPSNRFVNSLTRSGAVLCLALVIVSSSTFFFHALNQSHPYKTPLLQGMYGNSAIQVEELDNSFAAVDRHAKNHKVLMVCYTGLLSVSTQGYLGADQWSWNLQPSEMISDRLDHLQAGNLILACHLSPAEAKRIDYLKLNGFLEILEENISFHIYKIIKSL